MFRFRRSRVFLLVAVVLVAGLFLATQSRSWPSHLPSTAHPFTQFESSDGKADDTFKSPKPPVLDQTRKEEEHSKGFPKIQLPGSAGKDGGADPAPRLKDTSAEKARPVPGIDHTAELVKAEQEAIAQASTSSSVVHWTPLPERHPVTSYIPLPTGRPHAMPKIQFAFGEEDPAFTKTRNRRKEMVKDAFLHHWKGYKKYAWGHDELTPKSGDAKDPFAGWGATLVDSLDTMWMMGLKDEFEEAVHATGKIDFTTTPYKEELPLFEVTIRYLGGLMSAFDIAGQQHKVLLQKATELGDLLYGAFDTENRMPITYYRWQPHSIPVYHKAGTSVIIAELGTLSMEFTRLAQLTGNDKYYDAIARITNELQQWQNHTKVPGLWPTFVDASNCADGTALTKSNTKVETLEQIMQDTRTPAQELTSDDAQEVAHDQLHDEYTALADAVKAKAGNQALDTSEGILKLIDSVRGKAKGKGAESVPRQLENMAHRSEKRAPVGGLPADYSNQPYCERVGFKSATTYDAYTMGGMVDSLYEYLPKEYLLLGGLNTQYQDMYNTAIEAIKKYLLFRPMIEDESRQLRMTGTYRTDGSQKDEDGYVGGTFETKTGHLGCFVGAVVGMGARLFDREHEMELAEQLTDACVWSYESTKSGIMADEAWPVACESMDSCPWNQTAWYDAIDPNAARRLAREHEQWEKATAEYEKQKADEAADGGAAGGRAPNVRRAPPSQPRLPGDEPMSLEAYMQQRITSNNYPKGVYQWHNTDYLLRPEAIESVFYMWRLTGDRKWHNKGWDMFQAIEKHTRAEHGYSAVHNVHTAHPDQMDAAESFWTGETLKYFFLLFDEPWNVSLDDWVFNTEAHPFQIPKPGGRRTAPKNVFQGPGTPILRVKEPN